MAQRNNAGIYNCILEDPTSFEECTSLMENELLAGTHAQVGIIFNYDRKLDIYHEAE